MNKKKNPNKKKEERSEERKINRVSGPQNAGIPNFIKTRKIN